MAQWRPAGTAEHPADQAGPSPGQLPHGSTPPAPPAGALPGERAGRQHREARAGLLTAVTVGLGGLALGLKLLVALKTRGTNDVVYWEMFLATLRETGGIGLYQQIPWFNHPPFVLHLLPVMDRLALATGLPFAFWLRLPAIVADAGSLAVLARLTAAHPRARLAGQPGAALALAAAAPVSIMVSGFHGNTDPVMIFFVLLSLYLLEVRHSPLLAGAAFGMALNIKVVPLIFVPAVFLYLPDARRRLGYFAAAAATVAAGSLPYIAADPAAIADNVLGYGSYYGYWGLSRVLNSLAPTSWLNQAYEATGRALALGLAALAAVPMNRPPKRAPLFLQCGLVAFLFMAVSPGFGIQYLAWLVPWVVGAGLGATALYYATSGLFAFLVYTYWSRGFPWYFADARDFHPEWWPAPIVAVELLCWASVVATLWLMVRRVAAARSA